MSVNSILPHLTLDSNSSFAVLGAVGVLLFVFWLIGQILRTAYLELRIRKMIAVENTNSLREYFNGISSVVSEYSAFPSRRNESPPFLRKGSAEWYSLIFMAMVHSLSLMSGLMLVNLEWNRMPSQIQALFVWVLPPLVAAIMFLWEFRFFTLRCHKYDLKRECETGHPNEYTLLKLKDPSTAEAILVKLGEFFESRYDKKIKKRGG